MTFTRTLAAAGLVLSASAASAVDCTAPEAPQVIDGKNASEQEMLEAQQAVKGFVAEGRQYIGCLKAEEQALGDDAAEEASKELVDLYNAMVDEMKSTSEEFNNAVRTYQAANAN
jgi:flagellar biosynthesis/type III secretory pathway protein FliH